MYTATGYISADNWPAGQLIVTAPSGMKTQIIDFVPIPWDSSSDFNVEVIEVYPTGTPPAFSSVDSGILLQTRSSFPASNVRKTCNSMLGSQIKVRASGQMNYYCNYIFTGEPLSRWPGYNTWLENGKGI